MTTSKIGFRVGAGCPDLAVVVSFDGQQILCRNLDAAAFDVAHEFVDDTQLHQLEITLQGKTDQHTALDAQGNIVQDQVAVLDQFCLDDIQLDQLVWKHAVYTHNFNGHAAADQHKFYSVMGCNGTVTFAFQSPVYLWLLENL